MQKKLGKLVLVCTMLFVFMVFVRKQNNKTRASELGYQITESQYTLEN